ncbi:MAG: class I SAM-dependent methyltransferase [Candidatus Micrarchaeota archaeon]|nr:class I SAM-dependent methyltransferase [Candidatus Micrarchaeota archaeon]
MIMKLNPPKNVMKMNEWANVARELQGEDLKQKIYDNTLVDLCGNLKGKHVLDYGAGPAVMANRIAGLGADVSVYDISEEMRKIAENRLGAQRVFQDAASIPTNQFDIVLCNLVTCIVPEDEVARIARNIRVALTDSGTAYIGFCNPRIHDLPESLIDFRMPSGRKYEENHEYKKVKKEGSYEIIELHRPIEWYSRVFEEAGLSVSNIHFTPGYDVNGRTVNDFVIFELKK